MHLYNNLDAYFHLATHGDSKALNLLLEEFNSRLKDISITNGISEAKYGEFVANFGEDIESLFMKMINDFDTSKGSFNVFISYVCKRRMIPAIQKWLFEECNIFTDLDLELAELASAQKQIGEDDVSLRRDMEIKKFRWSIASKSHAMTQDKRLLNKIILLTYAGYKAKEICEKLKISRGKLRHMQEKIKSDSDIMNLKLELK